jgi:endonuclease/exonuclease/phosphatase family metal-dependent hydrolase
MMTMLTKTVLGELLLICLLVAPTQSQKSAGAYQPDGDEPPSLSFDELVTLSNADNLPPDLDAKLNAVLHAVPLHNDASPHPERPVDPRVGPVVRVGFWNIERGFQFDFINQALSDPTKFEATVDTGKKLTDAQRTVIRDQAQGLRQADILALNEVDLGMKRTDYRDVARDLAESLHMNYVYGVEFVEVDGLEDLGTEGSHLENSELAAQMDADLKPDPARYRGFHGNAILSRYPIQQARILRLPVCHDWYFDEKKEISKLEQGKRLAANKIFLERIEREVRRGGRMAIIANISVPDSPTGAVTIVNAHLENKCKPSCRRKQIAALLEAIQNVQNPIVLTGDMNTTGATGSPISVRGELIRLVKDYEFWIKQAINWFTPLSLPTYALMPFKFWRTYRDPTATSVPIISSNPEAGLFRDLRKFRFADGNSFDFRGTPTHNADGRGGTLANSNPRAWKGFVPTFAMPRDFGGVTRLKLDWFFVKPLAKTSAGKHRQYQLDPYFPRSMQDLNESVPDRLSDHAPMTVDLPLAGVPAGAPAHP